MPKLRLPPDKGNDIQEQNLPLILNEVRTKEPRKQLIIKPDEKRRILGTTIKPARSTGSKNTMMLLNNQKQTNKFKNELIKAGKTDTAKFSITDLTHQDTDVTESLMKEAQETVPNARGPRIEEYTPLANPTLKDPLLQQNQPFDANVPVPPAPKELPTAQPQVPNPSKSEQLDLANMVKQLLHQPKSKLKDPELSFEISPQAAASNLELLKRHDYDLK